MGKTTVDGPALPWSDSFNVGIKELDVEHRAMVQQINEICSHQRAGRRERVNAELDLLCTLAAEHFEREETVLHELAGYPHLTVHAGEHRNRLKQLAAMRQRFRDATDAAAEVRVCDDLVHWFVQQSVGHDAEIRSYIDDWGSRFGKSAGTRR